ncbi:hypothetical protein XENOCAPTIV_017365 [Xenoophorus captivus]|uniref:Uncharacterized protein n=1 Tax=Xenoophorus captivus TaxID=1517983 RepID=A0ABV0RTM1_9TELE
MSEPEKKHALTEMRTCSANIDFFGTLTNDMFKAATQELVCQLVVHNSFNQIRAASVTPALVSDSSGAVLSVSLAKSEKRVSSVCTANPQSVECYQCF